MTALAIIVLVAAAADEPAKVRASHRVDVIAPGEKVETVLDRMRAGKPPSPPSDAQARFRAGRAADALEALDAAAKAADPPEAPLWHYNRAACLYELQRFGESVLDYEQAAADPSLAAVSLVNAGFAAFDAGSPEQ